MQLWPLCLVSDYGLTTYRKEDLESSNNGFNCGDVNRLYCAPEVLLGSTSNTTPAADVYRCVRVIQNVKDMLPADWKSLFLFLPLLFLSYSMILVEIATRSDLNSVSKATLPKGRDPPPQYNEHLTLTGPRWRNEDGYNVAPTSAWAEGRKGRHWLSQWSRLLWGLVHGQSLAKKKG